MFSYAKGERATDTSPLSMPPTRPWWPCRAAGSRLETYAVHGYDGLYFTNGRRYIPENDVYKRAIRTGRRA
jgi:hypothetical protein